MGKGGGGLQTKWGGGGCKSGFTHTKGPAPLPDSQDELS